MKNIVLFASGNGSNAEEIIRYFKNNNEGVVVAIFSNKADAKVLERAKNHNIPSVFFSKTQLNDGFVLEQLHQFQPDLIILDYHLDGVEKGVMNGIETLDKIKEFNSTIPVIMLSSQDKIEVAIDCMHHKAHDYIVKSETAFLKLQNNMQSIFNFKQVEKKLNWYMDRM
jgi:CheY-like chemotaxis protein